jgi:hypothetical protein
MKRVNDRVRMCRCLAAVFLLAVGMPLVAQPWADAGDLRLRADLQLLSDHGVIRSPGMAWPRPWPDIAAAVEDADVEGLPQHVLAALARVRAGVEAASHVGQPRVEASVSGAVSPTDLRTFADGPRDRLEGSLSVSGMGDRFAGRLRVTGVGDPDDGQHVRLDGSYGSVVLGNWIATAGWVDRWWGPGHEGSLILSSNARPLPSVALDRNVAEAFESPWLSWIGPWRFGLSYGVLDDGSKPRNAHFVTMRLTARPFESLEVGLGRVIIWCGDGRPCGFSNFADSLFGNESQDVESDNPGNQLASIDFRLSSPYRWAPVALYGQLTGEDSISPNGTLDLKSYLPSKRLNQLGIEVWTGFGDRSLRAHLEVSDTVCRFSVPNTLHGCAYEHHIYTDGVRYRGRAIANAMDGDGRMYSLGATLVDSHGDPWNALVRRVELNVEGLSAGNTVSDEPATLYNAEFTHVRHVNLGKIEVGLGYDHYTDGSRDDRVRGQAKLTIEF